MQRSFTVLLLLGLVVTAVPAAAQDTESLRRELEQMRRQFESVRQEYQKAIDSMTERLQRLEAKPQSAATQPMVVQAPPAPVSPPGPTLLDYARPRAPFALAERSGRGQLLFDFGAVSDFVANLTQDNIDKANAGTFNGRENRVFPREVELLLFGQIDPYARGEVRIEAAEEFEDGERLTEVHLAEANLTLLTLPFGTQAKIGLLRNRFGLLNERHREALPQTDNPNVLTRFLGEEGLNESGAELTWVPPLPFYLEVLGGLFNGDNDVAFGRGSLKQPLATGRLRTFLELGDIGGLQLGASVASGQTGDRLRATLLGFDAKYKLTPEGWRTPLLTLGGEALWSHRRINVTRELDEEVDTDGDGVPDTTVTVERGEKRTRKRFGWYTYGEVQPWRQWAFGVRYDSTQFPEDPGREWAVQPYVSYMPSEFLRFRLGYKHTERDRRELLSANDASARIADELFLQATFFLGAHPAHPF